jgi:hypothetical protein
MSRALNVVSNRSAFVVLREAFYGTTRFDDFVIRTVPIARKGFHHAVVKNPLRSTGTRSPSRRRPRHIMSVASCRR